MPVELSGTSSVLVYFLLESYIEAQLFILTNGDCKEEDQLFNNDTQYTERCAFSWNPQNLFNIHEMFL